LTANSYVNTINPWADAVPEGFDINMIDDDIPMTNQERMIQRGY
jgi:hypothetical protein